MTYVEGATQSNYIKGVFKDNQFMVTIGYVLWGGVKIPTGGKVHEEQTVNAAAPESVKFRYRRLQSGC